MDVHPDALKSRLQAVCQNGKIPWARDESNVSLARKVVDAGLWPTFSEKYEMHFDPDTGEFIDIGELAHAMYVTETNGTEEAKEQLRKRIGDTQKEA